ncbi:hypothetical protein BaRGS_00036997 [Batillaria attramentaria]|uniref:Uncharacterized protein n=1 Tax=Batillaria attramentaria TaxID=370345 RepID=A0ABD0JA71_9CAEN
MKSIYCRTRSTAVLAFLIHAELQKHQSKPKELGNSQVVRKFLRHSPISATLNRKEQGKSQVSSEVFKATLKFQQFPNRKELRNPQSNCPAQDVFRLAQFDAQYVEEGNRIISLGYVHTDVGILKKNPGCNMNACTLTLRQSSTQSLALLLPVIRCSTSQEIKSLFHVTDTKTTL